MILEFNNLTLISYENYDFVNKNLFFNFNIKNKIEFIIDQNLQFIVTVLMKFFTSNLIEIKKIQLFY